MARMEGYRKTSQSCEKATLTARENEVLFLVAEGKGNLEISECLGTSLRTVKTHLTNIFLKVEVSRRTETVARCKTG